MTAITAGTAARQQRFNALATANSIRTGRADLKRSLKAGEITISDVLAGVPREAATWPIFDMLCAQRRYGKVRARKLLRPLGIPELKPTGDLTPRQRDAIVEALERRIIL